MEWDRLKTFYHVVLASSFTRAAEVVRVSQSAVSRQIRSIEEELGCALFVRSKNGLIPTQEGKVLFSHVQDMYRHAEYARRVLQEGETRPQGMIRLAVTTDFLTGYLSPFLPGFLKDFPEIQVSIDGRNHSPDWNILEFDIAIGPTVQDHHNLIAHHLLANQVQLYAHPNYLRKWGNPKMIEDLKEHRLILYGRSHYPLQVTNWPLYAVMKSGKVRAAYLEINNPEIRVQMAMEGLGICAVSREHPGLLKTGLIQVLPNIPGPRVHTYMMYPDYFKDQVRLIAFRNYIITQFRQTYLDRCYSQIEGDKVITEKPKPS